MACPAIHEDEGNHQEQVGELIKQTAASIDDLALKMLFITVQQNNLEVCIEYAVNKSVIHLSTVASTYLSIPGISLGILQPWYIFTWILEIWALKWTKEDLIYKTASWFGHCYFQVCKLKAFSGAMTEVKKNHVRVQLLSGPEKMVTTDISGCKCHDPMLVTKFNLDNSMWVWHQAHLTVYWICKG